MSRRTSGIASYVSLDSIISAAGELKYIGAIKRALAAEFKQPEDDWVKFLTSKVYEGAYTQKVREQFTSLVTKATKQFLNDQVNERLKAALGQPNFPMAADAEIAATVTSEKPAEDDLIENGIETTLEELEGYHIVRAIVCGEVKPARVVQRDAKSYFAILLDDNNRKPIGRLHFNRAQKYLGVFDENKIETRIRSPRSMRSTSTRIPCAPA
ncbi:hypothetical protein QFZ23_001937 [Arthrobacter globiformis]|uniref:hypothetical protein n=1 Tax=Arthrobacter globiformis TaxID=1665 RepID=UPI002780B0FB|nr:hypothetical protein [Arthrobacter globiformis]